MELHLPSSGLLFPFVQKACRKLEESERLVETLQADVSALKKQLSEKRQNGANGGLLSFFLSEISNTRSNPVGLKPVSLLAASDEDPPEEKNNLMLHKAIRTLFARAPLLHTQTLNLAAHPVPETCCCCTENNAEGTATALEQTDAAEDQESLSLLSPCRTKPQKRQRGADLVRERKRRKSCS